MLLRLTKKEEIEIITNISIDAFHSDVLIGLDSNDGPPEYDSITWHKQMQNEKHLYTYLNDDGIIVGGAILFASTSELYIGRIFISPQYHKKGYGISLMNDIEDMFSFVKKFKLDTPINNVRTNSFYKKLDYIQSGFDGDCVVYVKNNKK